MKNQNRWQFGAAVLLLALWMTSGCANKQNVAENEQVDGFSETAANPSGDGDAAPTDANASTESELLGDAPKDAAADPNAPKDATTTADAGAAGTDPAMESLFEQSNQEQAATQDPNFDALAKSDGTAPMDTGTTPTADPSAMTTTGDTTTAATLSDPAATSDAQAFSGTPTFTTAPKTYAGAVLPKIPGRALSRKGANLNRYYFLRQGDTPSSVSELIYGGSAQAANLKKWNKGRWIPGKVIYYNSPTQADDAQMVSFYEERNLTPEEYKVGKGDSMSNLAKKKLGSTSSWKELAITNGLSSPDTLRKGQTIKLYTNLGSASSVAQATPEPVAPPPVIEPPQPVTPPTMAQAPMVNPNTPPMPDPMADDLNKVKKKPKKEGLKLGKMLSQETFSLVMGLGVALLVVSLMMINKRKRAASSVEEFNEDAFAAPGKKKRR